MAGEVGRNHTAAGQGQQTWTIWKHRGEWDDVIEGPDTPHAGVRVISLDAAVAAIIERYCDTSRGILCSDFRQAADFLREEFGAESACAEALGDSA